MTCAMEACDGIVYRDARAKCPRCGVLSEANARAVCESLEAFAYDASKFTRFPERGEPAAQVEHGRRPDCLDFATGEGPTPLLAFQAMRDALRSSPSPWLLDVHRRAIERQQADVEGKLGAFGEPAIWTARLDLRDVAPGIQAGDWIRFKGGNSGPHEVASVLRYPDRNGWEVRTVADRNGWEVRTVADDLHCYLKADLMHCVKVEAP